MPIMLNLLRFLVFYHGNFTVYPETEPRILTLRQVLPVLPHEVSLLRSALVGLAKKAKALFSSEKVQISGGGFMTRV